MTFEFWQRWLLAASVFFAAFGVIVAILPFGPPFSMRNDAIADAFFAGLWTDGSARYHAFSAGPLGGTITGFYVLQSFIAAVPFRRRERWAWHAIAWATATWFIIDSAVSLWHGAAFNVYMVNIVPIAVFGVPLLATMGDFPGRSASRRVRA